MNKPHLAGYGTQLPRFEKKIYIYICIVHTGMEVSTYKLLGEVCIMSTLLSH